MKPQLKYELPEALIAELRRAAPIPVLTADQRETAQAWLRCALVDFRSLDRHIRLLQRLYDSPFRYPRPRRDGPAEQQAAVATASRFPFAEPLPEPRIVALIDEGVDVLGGDELATLMLNPVALFDLFDVIDELHPDAWLDAMHEAGSRSVVMNEAGSRPPVVSPPTPKVTPILRAPVSPPWYASPWLSGALAACLLVAVGAGAWLAWQKGDADRKRLDALAELEAVKGRGPVGALQRDVVRLQAASAGFALPAYQLWDGQYVEGDSPKANLDRIAEAGGPEAMKAIEKQRKEGKPDFAILAEFRVIAEQSRKAKE